MNEPLHKQIPVLTGFRAVAALLVLLFHYNPFAPSGSTSVLYALVNEGHLGVSLFFVLSGFLIAWRYADQAKLSRTWLKSYLLKRFARIYPLYFILTGISFFFYIAEERGSLSLNDWILYLLNITFLKGFFNDFKFTLIPQAWSLTVEECFYLMAPFFFLLIHRRAYFIYLLPLLIFTTGLLLVGIAQAVSSNAHQHFYGFLEDVPFMLTYTIFGRCLEFFVGIALAIYLRHTQATPAPGFRFTALGLLAIFFLVSLAAFANFSDLSRLTLHQYVLPFATAFLMYGLITEKTLLNQLLASKVFDWLGRSSYALYLIHLGFIPTLLERYLSHNSGVIAIFVIACSLLLWKWVEEPLQKAVLKLGRA